MAEPGRIRKKRAEKNGAVSGEAGVPVPEEPVPSPGEQGPENIVVAGPDAMTAGSAGPDVSPSAADASKEPEPETIEDPIEILVGLAERGEIDPWNIDIIEVTDRFLSELERRRQLNLQVSGRTLFFAATLLRMKSEQLDIPSEEEESETGDGEDYDLAGDLDFEDEGRLGPIERLEREIQRRLDRKNLRKSPVTLFELIIELKNLEKEERRRRRLPPADDDYLVEADDVVGIAHEE
ncbi:MAG: segregation/condensation protein A, partial [Methanoregula sp.]